MKHCISLEPETDYARILDLISEEDDSVEAWEFILETDGAGNPYHSLTITTDDELSEELEMDIIRLPNVLVTVFNIDEAV